MLYIEVSSGLDHKVVLMQTSKTEFTVIYGRGSTARLSYSKAMQAFSHCVQHSGECTGIL